MGLVRQARAVAPPWAGAEAARPLNSSAAKVSTAMGRLRGNGRSVVDLPRVFGGLRTIIHAVIANDLSDSQAVVGKGHTAPHDLHAPMRVDVAPRRQTRWCCW